MPKFIVKDRMACWVTWSYEVEADDEDAALDAFCQGDHGEAGEPEIGDSVDMLDNELTVVTVEPPLD